MKMNLLSILSKMIFVCCFIMLTQGCNNAEPAMTTAEQEKKQVEKMLQDAGFTKISGSTSEFVDKAIELKTPKEVVTFLEKMKKNKKISGKIKLRKGEIKDLGNGNFSINITKKGSTKNFSRTRLAEAEVWDYAFDIRSVSFSFTLDVQFKYNRWKIEDLTNLDVTSSLWIEDFEGKPNDDLEFYIMVYFSTTIIYDDGVYINDDKIKYEFELEVYQEISPSTNTFYGELKYEGEVIASSKKDE